METDSRLVMREDEIRRHLYHSSIGHSLLIALLALRSVSPFDRLSKMSPTSNDDNCLADGPRPSTSPCQPKLSRPESFSLQNSKNWTVPWHLRLGGRVSMMPKPSQAKRPARRRLFVCLPELEKAACCLWQYNRKTSLETLDLERKPDIDSWETLLSVAGSMYR